MKLRKFSAVMMAAILATSSPVSAYLGEITAFAKKDEDKEEKDYSIGDASWDTTEDSDGKTHVYATWSEPDYSSSGKIVIYVDDKNRTSDATNGGISASTKSGKLELTKYIKKINRTGEYTFKITPGKATNGEKESAESDVLEVDSDFLKSLASSSSSSSSSSSGSSSSTPGGSSSSSSSSTPASGSSPADAMNGGSQNSTQNSSQAPNQESTSRDQWQNWAPYGWVYIENGIPVTNKWVVESDGKWYHIGTNGFMDVDKFVDDEYGHHYVGADGALMY